MIARLGKRESSLSVTNWVVTITASDDDCYGNFFLSTDNTHHNINRVVFPSFLSNCSLSIDRIFTCMHVPCRKNVRPITYCPFVFVIVISSYCYLSRGSIGGNRYISISMLSNGTQATIFTPWLWFDFLLCSPMSIVESNRPLSSSSSYLSMWVEGSVVVSLPMTNWKGLRGEWGENWRDERDFSQKRNRNRERRMEKMAFWLGFSLFLSSPPITIKPDVLPLVDSRFSLPLLGITNGNTWCDTTTHSSTFSVLISLPKKKVRHRCLLSIPVFFNSTRSLYWILSPRMRLEGMRGGEIMNQRLDVGEKNPVDLWKSQFLPFTPLSKYHFLYPLIFQRSLFQ